MLEYAPDKKRDASPIRTGVSDTAKGTRNTVLGVYPSTVPTFPAIPTTSDTRELATQCVVEPLPSAPTQTKGGNPAHNSRMLIGERATSTPDDPRNVTHG